MPKTQPYLTDKGQRRCAGIKTDGQGCRSFALRDEDRCWVHSERRQSEVRAAQSAGGYRSRGGKIQARLEAVIERLYGEDEKSFRLSSDLDDEDNRPLPEVVLICVGSKVAGFLCVSPLRCALENPSRLHTQGNHSKRQQALALVGLWGIPGAYHQGHRSKRMSVIPDVDVDRFLTGVGIKEPRSGSRSSGHAPVPFHRAMWPKKRESLQQGTRCRVAITSMATLASSFDAIMASVQAGRL